MEPVYGLLADAQWQISGFIVATLHPRHPKCPFACAFPKPTRRAVRKRNLLPRAAVFLFGAYRLRA